MSDTAPRGPVTLLSKVAGIIILLSGLFLTARGAQELAASQHQGSIQIYTDCSPSSSS